MADSGFSLLSAAALLAAAGMAAQVAPIAPPVLTGSDKAMEQYESFRIHVERDGPYDLVVLGNSVARQAVDIPRLTALLGGDRDEPLRAYNFGVGGTPTLALPYMAELVRGVGRPRHAVVVLTIRMARGWTPVAWERGETLHSSPYGEALRDPVPWRGALRRWLLDHVAIFGLRYGFKAALLGEETVAWTPGRYDPGFGFKVFRQRDDVEPKWDRAGDYVRERSIPEARTQEVAEVVRQIQALGFDVWLAEAPPHPERVAMLRETRGEAMVGQTGRLIREVAAETGARALVLPEDLYFASDEFVDRHHTNARGAARYTEWLAGELELDAARR